MLADDSLADDHSALDPNSTDTREMSYRILEGRRGDERAQGTAAVAVPDATRSDVSNETSSGPLASSARPIVFPASSVPTTTFEARQLWEGVVEEIHDVEKELLVTLYDGTNRRNPPERAFLSLDEVPESDKALVAVGAIFYWSIGYERSVHGQKRSVSEIRFRRLPTWTKRELADLRREAEEMVQFFKQDG